MHQIEKGNEDHISKDVFD